MLPFPLLAQQHLAPSAGAHEVQSSIAEERPQQASPQRYGLAQNLNTMFLTTGLLPLLLI